MRTEELKAVPLSMALYRMVMSFDRNKNNECHPKDIAWVIDYLDTHATRNKQEFEDSIDSSISWTLLDGSFFCIGNPKQECYSVQFYALDAGWE